jgi:hypothetical protein
LRVDIEENVMGLDLCDVGSPIPHWVRGISEVVGVSAWRREASLPFIRFFHQRDDGAAAGGAGSSSSGPNRASRLSPFPGTRIPRYRSCSGRKK